MTASIYKNCSNSSVDIPHPTPAGPGPGTRNLRKLIKPPLCSMDWRGGGEEGRRGGEEERRTGEEERRI